MLRKDGLEGLQHVRACCLFLYIYLHLLQYLKKVQYLLLVGALLLQVNAKSNWRNRLP